MTYSAVVLADSVSEAGYRLTTFEVTFPRIVLPEFNTHRMLSRNSASSRAIPVTKQLQRILDDPYIPAEFGVNRPGMQHSASLTGEKDEAARRIWLDARDSAVRHVIELLAHETFLHERGRLPLREQVSEVTRKTEGGAIPDGWLNVHKQLANRLLEPFMWHTVIVTATEWDNFWHLRTHRDAQLEIRRLAELMLDAWNTSTPRECRSGDWHLPLASRAGERALDAYATSDLIKICVGRCARVSYVTHAGKREPRADIMLHDRLLESGHLSPFEHAARPLTADELAQIGLWQANLRGWMSYRRTIPFEEDILGHRESAEPGCKEGGR